MSCFEENSVAFFVLRQFSLLLHILVSMEENYENSSFLPTDGSLTKIEYLPSCAEIKTEPADSLPNLVEHHKFEELESPPPPPPFSIYAEVKIEETDYIQEVNNPTKEKQYCVICQKITGDRIILFNVHTLKRAADILHVRQMFCLKFNEVSLPLEINATEGYHRYCYSNFTALNGKYKRRLYGDPTQESVANSSKVPTRTEDGEPISNVILEKSWYESRYVS